MTEQNWCFFKDRGYSWRSPVTVERIAHAVKFVKRIKPDVAVMVDNCYGEFVEDREPADAGTDIMAGSLIKNPGGGIALSGGYIAGRKDLVELISYRMTVPGLGREVGATLGQNRTMFEGFSWLRILCPKALRSGICFSPYGKSRL